MRRGNLSRRQALKLAAATPLAVSAALGASLRSRPPADAPYRDARVPVDLRVRDLLSRMSVEEKVAQLIALWATKADILDGLDFSPTKAATAYPAGIGQITRACDKRGIPGIPPAAGGGAERWRTPAQTIEFVNAAQRWACEQTRLGIPVLFHEESLHGYMATDATQFPLPIALAGTFEPTLVRDINRVIAREVRARGVPLVLSPVVDIARDPRWGRIEETFGEDPYLVGEMGVAAVQGLQGSARDGTLADDGVFATLKHMTGHGQPESGNNVAPARVSERELRTEFLGPFRTIVERTAVRAVMPSYNEIDGVPSHANHWLLRAILREEWGFDGVVLSDYDGIAQLASLHRVAADVEEAARTALAAGVDTDLPDGEAYRTLVAQVHAGKVDLALVDAAVARVLELKFRAGLFESPYADLAHAERITGDTQARELARSAARKSMCLLKNDGTLPLVPGAQRCLAVIGPNAAIARLGGYSGVPKQSVTLLDGVRAFLGDRAEVLHAQGVYITQSEDRSADEVLLAEPEQNRALVAEAVRIARRAELIVLAIGDTEQTSREGFASNHLGDRTSLDLVGQQNELFEALLALGKPIVVCAINGRPASWPLVAERANAILECWYPGQEGGTAMAEALFGAVNPGAKLAVTVARDVGHLPQFYNHKPSARRGYLFADNSPLFPFGHGLSYTRFEIARPHLSSPVIGRDEEVEVSVEVRNTGDRAGDEVVQLYLHDQVASVTQPVKRLCRFRRVTLEPGGRTTVRFRLGPADFRICDVHMEELVEPGKFTILAGPDSVALQATELQVI